MVMYDGDGKSRPTCATLGSTSRWVLVSFACEFLGQFVGVTFSRESVPTYKGRVAIDRFIRLNHNKYIT